ncbi:hypothetical protein ACFL7M_06045 [Thermodesulfobacteriota bacterium]
MDKPTVSLCNKGFFRDAKSSASVKGMPGLRIVLETVPPHCTITEQIEAGVSAAMDDIITALTKPLTEEEKSPKPNEVVTPSRIAFKGNLDEVNRFFYKRGWTDGLPIIPPTEEKVAEMLTGTDLPADYEVAKIIPRLGKATVEKIAVNAVMAGALPTYMPVLIAGVQASHGPNSLIGPWQLGSTLSPAPFWIINGPIRNDLLVNSGTGALAPGEIANAAIGRAMQLIVKNIGGIRKGIEDMGVIGNPWKYTLTFAENEEESPWEPLHVEQGFKKEDSTVTVSSGNSFQIKGSNGTSDKGILSAMIQYVSGEPNTYYFIILPPEYAKILDSKGWTKKEIHDFVSSAIIGNSQSAGITRSGGMQIVVAGGPGPCWIGLLKAFFGRRVTQKVELPANWDNLVKKYKDIVPTYIMY